MSSRPLLSRFASWAEERPDAPALGLPRSLPDGGGGLEWTPRRDLLAAVRATVRAEVAAGVAAGSPVVVDPGDPRGAVIGLMAAEGLGRAAVVRSPDWDDAALASIVAALAARPEDGAGLLVLPTSGSRGRPRAVLRTSRSWAAGLLPFSRLTGITARAAQQPGRDGLVWAPGTLGSTLTLWAVWHALGAGVPVAATGPWHRSGPAVLATDRPAGPRGQAWLQAVPAIAEDALDAVRRGLVTPPAGVIVAGAAVPDALEAGWRALGVPVTTYYGAAELSFVAARGSAIARTGTARTGAGLRAFPGVAVELREGEIWARSRYTALGYLGEPGPATWRDGWVSVHDRGTLDGDGALRVLGRGDSAILVGATTVLTADVESALGSVAGVAEIVCLSESDARLGERIVAVVRPAGRDGHLVTRLREAARQSLAAPSRPSRYVLREEFPRTSAGKVARDELRRDLARDPVRGRR